MITQLELKELLHYDSETGILKWNKNSRNYIIGKIAGYLHYTGYVLISIKNKSYSAHRLAWLYVYGDFPKQSIDHINGIKNDNRIDNLRLADISQNNMNRLKPKNNKSGYKGVSWKMSNKKWLAQCCVYGKYHCIGYYDCPIEASKAYEEFAKLHFKEFYKS